ncbi:aspartate/glutamate racemase family protein [Streptomyces bobili]|uniref:aspartate/glutamate racemase family protein n=1 Tax=Streptomyces bobili TaxID=67280 RepID=UPI002B1E8779|nr:aspartate/glutamate racemase family protein [Streptomyces bobili]
MDPHPLSALDGRVAACRACPRPVEWREEVARTERAAFADWTYWGRPVPGFGPPDARLLIVGPAPAAHVLGRRYGVVTTLERSRGQIEDSPELAGVGRNCAAVVGTGLGVLDLGDTDRTQAAFLAAAERARDAGAEVLVLGCAGMTGLQRALGEKLGLPVVDGVAAAVKPAEALVTMGLRTSRVGSLAKPVPKRRTWGAGRD